ncbi:enhancer of split m7 protein-like [Rhineura floridana]|uniref:enhancer of split m7 protein-like n=1 Tax=Rhineura floridana TaxID=261503 RepID=UPI002AC87E1A|nr:enhancer of split m7 protein-like [Rhineura floridana]
MNLEAADSKTSLTTTGALRGCSWRKPHLEQPKHFVYKKIIKPLMEKKRRNRIAHFLNQLKTLLLDGSTHHGNKPLPNSRMDKATLLEMTVQRIQTLQLAVAEDRGFHTGYAYCASLVQAFLISETHHYLDAPSHSNSSSRPTSETPSLATPSASNLEKFSRWSERCLASPGFRRFEESVSSGILNRTGPQVFWRPWST